MGFNLTEAVCKNMGYLEFTNKITLGSKIGERLVKSL